MNETTFAALEYDRLCELVARYSQTPMGRARFEDLMPATSRRDLERDLARVTEVIALNEEKQVSWSFNGLEDPAAAIAILRIRNSVLEPMKMLELTRVCNQALFARSAVSPEKDFVPAVWAIVEQIPTSLFQTISGITKRLLPSGEIDDSASPELARIRRELNQQRGRLQKSLESAIRSFGDAIQDAIVTQRNDRYVIPVKSDFRGKVSGVAHGFSSSGATIFVEPLEAIEANNELQNLKGKEEREVARIIFALSEELREQLPGIELAVEAVGELDFIKAKVEFARAFRAVVPTISDDGKLDLVDARHPLLEENLRTSNSDIPDSKGPGSLRDSTNPKSKITNPKSDIVPVSFALDAKHSVMIISGANAGGKTVVLKTAGLLSLMGLSGLPVPARAATVPFYKSILADIGDHQSLSANLSTFSSHISNIAAMLGTCQSPALILLDEVGTGTDPDEGSALGVAVVDWFRQKIGAQVIASTHYRGLKMYAANDPDVVNASVEFDEKTLQPTYRLLVGLAGASSGIEIARRFGIRDEVIAAARENLDLSAREAENYLIKLSNETRHAEDIRIALEEERETTATKYAKLDIEFRKKEKQRQKEFESELARTIAEFERQSKAFIDSLEDKALKNKLDKERLARKAELNRAVLAKVGGGEQPAAWSANESVPAASAGGRAPGDVKIGVSVRTSFGVGRVERINGDIAEVLVGSMRLREPVAKLTVVEVEAVKESLGEKLRNQAKASNLRLDTEDMNAELNLIGRTTADAEYEIDRFLDEAYLASLPRVRIIHGFGTGALKNFVHHFLKGHAHIAKFGFAPQDQGGQARRSRS
ncbi:MAG: endonuclease MutS2 [Acidobacteria bacterium]|nr:endonuclease MutS2 [Acidobacteriota bacterium]